jgi:hypothetical protein
MYAITPPCVSILLLGARNESRCLALAECGLEFQRDDGEMLAVASLALFHCLQGQLLHVLQSSTPFLIVLCSTASADGAEVLGVSTRICSRPHR